MQPHSQQASNRNRPSSVRHAPHRGCVQPGAHARARLRSQGYPRSLGADAVDTTRTSWAVTCEYEAVLMQGALRTETSTLYATCAGRCERCPVLRGTDAVYSTPHLRDLCRVQPRAAHRIPTGAVDSARRRERALAVQVEALLRPTKDGLEQLLGAAKKRAFRPASHAARHVAAQCRISRRSLQRRMTSSSTSSPSSRC